MRSAALRCRDATTAWGGRRRGDTSPLYLESQCRTDYRVGAGTANHRGADSVTLARIAYIVNVFPKLSETFIAGELAELRRRGIDIRILSLRPPTETIHHRFIDEAGLFARVCYQSSEFETV